MDSISQTPKELQNEINNNRRRLHDATAGLNYYLELFGDELARQHGYKDLDGLEACRYHLMQKHHWLPRDVNSMSLEELRFALSQELSAKRSPAAARG